MDYVRTRNIMDFHGGEGGETGRRGRTLRQSIRTAGGVFTTCVEESTYFDILLCTAIFIIFACFFFWLGIRFGSVVLHEDDILLRARRSPVEVEPAKSKFDLLRVLESIKADQSDTRDENIDILHILKDNKVKEQYCLF